MCFKRYCAVLFVSICGTAVAQQNTRNQSPAPPVPQTDADVDPRDDRQRPLTPEEQMDRQIRQFDPLDPGDRKPNDKPGNDKGRNDKTKDPLPGSIAATEKDKAAGQNRGPKVVENEDDAPASKEFGGPAVLSRTYTVNRPMITQEVKWQESFGVNSIFSTGIVRPTLDPSGSQEVAGNLYGTSLTGTLIGRRLWRHDQLGVNLNGQYQASFPSYGIYNGPNATLSLDYTHLFSRRWSMSLTDTGSVFSQNYTLQNPTVSEGTSIADINISSSPNIQIFDTGTKQFASQADVTWQKSTRLSFNFGVGYFDISRNAPSLIGSEGEQARGDVNYRVNRKMTTGVYYSFNHYAFQHATGTMDTHTVGLIYSYAFSKTLQLRLRGGGSSSENIGLTSVQLDPLIAALLGRSTIVVDAYRKIRSSDISAQLVKDFRGGRTFSAAYVRGISPGNGVFQASTQETINVSMSTRFMRVFLLNVSGGRDSLSSISQSLGKYTSENAQIGVSRTFRHGLAWNGQVSYRYFEIFAPNPVHSQVFISSGVTWTPEAGRLWPF